MKKPKGVEQIKRAISQGKLKIGNHNIFCANLEDGTRVISCKDIEEFLGLNEKKIKKLMLSKDVKQSLSNRLIKAIENPIIFSVSGDKKHMKGFESWVIPDLLYFVIKFGKYDNEHYVNMSNALVTIGMIFYKQLSENRETNLNEVFEFLV